MVSIGSQKDVLVAETQDENFFSRIDNPENINRGTQVKFSMPRQFNADDEFNIFVNEIHSLILQAAQVLLISNVGLTLVVAISLKAFWNLLNVIQVLTFLIYFTSWPAIVSEVLNSLFEAITLKPIIDPIFEKGKSTFEIKQSENQNEFLQQQGVQSKDIFQNLGIYLIFFFLAVFAVTLYFTARICARKRNLVQKLINSIKKYIFYQGPIRYVIVGYLRLLSVFLSIFVFEIADTSRHHGFLVLYGLLSLALVLWPLWIVYFLLKNSDKLAEESFRNKFNALIDNIKVDKFNAVIYNAVFAVRRFNILLFNLWLSQDSPLSGAKRTFYFEKIILFISV